VDCLHDESSDGTVKELSSRMTRVDTEFDGPTRFAVRAIKQLIGAEDGDHEDDDDDGHELYEKREREREREMAGDSDERMFDLKWRYLVNFSIGSDWIRGRVKARWRSRRTINVGVSSDRGKR
jgi:hypothetical protein